MRVEIDLSCEEFRNNPWPVYSPLRQHDPVHWSATENSFFLLRFEDVQRALGSEVFSAEPPSHLRHEVLGATIRDSEGTDHQLLRTLFRPIFRRSQTGVFVQTLIQPVVDRVLGRIAVRGEADFVSQFAVPIATRVAARILGIPGEDAGWLYRQLHVLMQDASRRQHGEQQVARVRDRTHAYFLDVVRRQDRIPRDSLIGQAMANLGSLDLEILFQNLLLLFAAATKPTVAALANITICLLRNPAALAAARRNPELLPAMVAESLRWETPLDIVSRFAAQSVQIAGVLIAPGTPVQLSLASANRDEARFREPEVWNPDRAAGGHLAFGWGRHHCLGRHLALRELEIAFAMLLARFEDLRPAQDPLPPIRGPFVRLPGSLRIAVRSH